MPAKKTTRPKSSAKKAGARQTAIRPAAAANLTVARYLDTLPADRRAELEKVRRVIRRHLPPGYQETTAAGMIAYVVPLRRFPDTYNGQPLWFAALGAKKNYSTLHLMPVYGNAKLEERLRAGFKAAGKKLDMGKACIRFRSADDLALDALGEIVASAPVDRFVATAEAARRNR